MTIDTTKESTCINQLVDKKNETRVIEGDIIVPDIKPDILSPLEATGNICIYKKEILDGKVKIDGSIQAYVIYLPDDETGGVRSLNTSLDFTETINIPNCNAGMNALIKTEIISLDAKVLNGRKVNIRATVNFCAKVYCNQNVEITSEINGINNIQKLENDIEVNSLIGEGCTKTYAKENIPIDLEDNLAEILNANITITNKDTKVSYNKVLAKADAMINILYLSEDNRISTCNRNIPVMGFIDIKDVNEDHICDTNYEIKNLILKPNGADEHSVYAEAEIEICCYVFEKKKLTLIEDLYSPTQNVNFSKKLINIADNIISSNDTCSIKERIEVPDLAGGKIHNIEINPIINLQSVTGENVSYEGEIKANILFWNEVENRMSSKTLILPIKFKTKLQGLNSNSDIETEISVKKQDFSLMPDGSLDIEVDIDFLVNSTNFRNVPVIDEITVDEDEKNKKYSMVIYYVKPGDTLWKIAKKMGSTVDEITKINEILDPNNLQIGEQLFIPKFCSRQSA